MILLINHDSSEGEQWGRYNLPRYIIYILLHILTIYKLYSTYAYTYIYTYINKNNKTRPLLVVFLKDGNASASGARAS